ncbi:putative metal-dependent HD superfamily phosphohydrolase [Flavobacterium endophyticum]|uniref:Putative metal-dependent HD superfamily phosphohydrolase n=1 Tax=Flavobacterium endophyticum TaxID=1540163 RepID=A0A495MGY1_9FLAO|nr:hypothetical protein [Flavobacterium endophyticum]RKS25224.1 putative metal-dependent HD superfamily phosphohydrolase [Flavobacterium endophyticum]
MLQQNFNSLFQKYNQDISLQVKLWLEIKKNHSSKKRHYHNLSHLENLFEELIPIKQEFEDWDTIQFSIYYHDIVYKTTRSDNEEKSAQLAVERLEQISYPEDKIQKCKRQILATKLHAVADPDTNLFTDADLSILGKSWEVYATYYQQIRKEYSIYPDFMYTNGRKKALQHFLDMEYIFKTSYFQNKYESQARRNLEKELQILGK